MQPQVSLLLSVGRGARVDRRVFRFSLQASR